MTKLTKNKFRCPERSKYLSHFYEKRMKCFKKGSHFIKKPSGHHHGGPEGKTINYEISNVQTNKRRNRGAPRTLYLSNLYGKMEEMLQIISKIIEK